MPAVDAPPSVVKGMLADTFEQLGFRIIYKENVRSAGMHQLMMKMQNEDHRTYDCFVCCIFSHGNEKGVSASDKIEVDVNALRKYFYATKCQQLVGKPKVFFVEACRGKDKSKGVPVETKADCTDSCNELPTYRWEMDEDHFFMSYATTPHHIAMGLRERGGHFFRCLTTNLLAHASNLPVDDILMIVGDRLRQLGIEQSPICETTLRKKLYLSNEQTETSRHVDHPRRTVQQLRDRYENRFLSGATTPQTAGELEEE